jgi:hypothetical protein
MGNLETSKVNWLTPKHQFIELSTYYVLHTRLSAWHSLSDEVLMTALWGKCCYPCFTEEETEAQSGSVTRPRCTAMWMRMSRFDLDILIPEPLLSTITCVQSSFCHRVIEDGQWGAQGIVGDRAALAAAGIRNSSPMVRGRAFSISDHFLWATS